MRTILYCWEQGANLGHILPFRQIADELDPAAFRLVFAVRDLAYARQAFGADAAIVQAPVWPRHRHFGSDHQMASFADILAMIGFADPLKLSAVVSAWASLIELVKPDLVVADFCPGLHLSLYGEDLPIVAIGTGAVMPPLERDRFPPLRGDRVPVVPEARLLEVARAVQERRNRPAPPTLPAIFRAAATIPFGLPELDPYRAFRSGLLYDPPEAQPSYVEPPQKRRLFVYAGAETPEIDVLAQALAELDMEIEAHLRGDVGPIPEFLRLRGVVVHDDPPPLHEVLPRVSHVLSQGGMYVSIAALRCGRPHMISPRHAETASTLEALVRMGAATALDLSGDHAAVADRIKKALLDPGMAKACHDIATMLAERPLPSGKRAVLDAIHRLTDPDQTAGIGIRQDDL